MIRREFRFPERSQPARPPTKRERKTSAINSLAVLVIGIVLIAVGLQTGLGLLVIAGLIAVTGAFLVGMGLLVKRQTSPE